MIALPRQTYLGKQVRVEDAVSREEQPRSLRELCTIHTTTIPLGTP